jgi:16S rRNA (guanine527-N7)-methyltransferase
MATTDSRLAQLAARYELGEDATRRLRTLLDLLLEDPQAPTAIRDRDRALDDHLADSLVALELAPVRAAERIADLGSGAGLPGLPLAIARPDAHVTLLEAASRKTAFIRRAAEACGLTNVSVVTARAEEHALVHPNYDLVTVRAVAALAVVAEYAAPLLRVGGTLVAWRGHREPDAEVDAEAAAEVLGLQVHDVVRVSPYAQARERHLHLMSKVTETPARFPRRPGMALKRPLGR